MAYLDNFHHQITGNPQGHKLVFLHGLMGSAANWLRITKAFANDFHILTFDQRGHGRSFHPEAGYNPRDFAHDLKLILDELGWSASALVGHSMGGRNALEFASHFSQRVKALVMEDIGPDSRHSAIDRIERLLALVPVPFSSRAEANEFFEKSYPDLISFYPQPRVVARFLHSNLEQKPDGTMDWRFAKEAILQSLREGRNADRWDEFANLKMPVLVVRGEHSEDLPRPVFERMLKTLPAARGVEIADAGHWVHFDQPEAFIRTLKEFLHETLGTNL
jgi:pimeloyl-ACP methyl ester carboxylesterase